MSVSEAAVTKRLKALKLAAKQIGQERAQLEKRMSFPRVQSVAYYWSHFSPIIEAYDLIADAIGVLEMGSEYGNLAIQGVTVNGAEVVWDRYNVWADTAPNWTALDHEPEWMDAWVKRGGERG